MKQTIKYNGPEEQKRQKALKDCEFYLSDIYNKTLGFITDCKTLDDACFALSFVGIQGYPAIVFAEEFGNRGEGISE